MKLTLLALTFVILLFLNAGCGCSRPGEAELKQNEAVLSPPTPTAGVIPKPAPEAKKVDKYVLDQGNVIVGKAKSFTVKPASDPIDISGSVVATDTRTGTLIREHTYSQARGKITGMPAPDSRMLYYPPSTVGEDVVSVRAIANDGLYKEFKVVILVGDGSSKPAGKRFTITSPADKSKTGLDLTIEGDIVGYQTDRLTMMVSDFRGSAYPQTGYVAVQDGHYSAHGYVGDPEGHGVGETFTVWMEDGHGHKTNVIHVTRE